MGNLYDKKRKISLVKRFCCKVFQKIYFSVKIEKKDREDRVMNHFKGKQFKKDVIIVAVGYYLRYNLSYFFNRKSNIA